MRRLYIGGLSHSVTQKDLKDRFGKFGEVVDVELRTRSDDEGVPYKTFGYININISDANLQKCLTVLNKSKWKGGTLQIEAAKESFLHRLAQEQQEAAEQRLRQSAAEEKTQKLLDSLSKVGVENFTMKSAVPGTEVPGHKDWVVTKFGRVVPILQLGCQKGRKVQTLKYDPSKYSHNIHRLDRSAPEESTPISQLTWQVQGGDDDISKKRRGEFPPYEPTRPKKSRTGVVCLDRTRRCEQLVNSDCQLTNGSEPPTNHRPAQHFPDSEVKSDQEICGLVADEQTSHDALQQEAEDSDLEVVGADYMVTSRLGGGKDDYDSTDTDELFASSKNVTADCFSAMTSEPVKERHGPPTTRKPSSSQEKPAGVLPVIKLSSSETDSDKEEESSDSSSDLDYEAMFSVPHLEISLADLQKLAETTLPSTSCSSPEHTIKPTRKGITPEEILASILEEDSEDEQPKKKRKTRKGRSSTPLPAFQGTKSLKETSGRDADVRQHKLNLQDSEMETPESREGEEEGKEVKNSSSPSGSKEEQEEATASVLLGAEEDEELQRKANIRRLAALHQRQREAEEQKKLIQGALSNLDAPALRVGRHVVFASEEEEEENEDTLSQNSQSESRAAVRQKTTETEVHWKPSGTQLFPQSEDGDDDEEDSSRFDLRPEFEGQAGQKLMELQSRFGTDERFRMDSRFLEGGEEDEEEKEANRSPAEGEEGDLEGEREKNLSILQSVLPNVQQTSRKMASKTTKFRDSSTLHYDPSREEHAAFETKVDGTKKESKAARRKKREEAQKLPAVSNEIYFDVSEDMKALFGQVKDEVGDGDKTSWDQVKDLGERKEDPPLSSLLLADPSNATEEPAGFKFSFFRDEAGTMTGEMAEYKAEKIQGPKVSWHQDPHFHDSSSEEEEEEQSGITAKIEEEEAPHEPAPALFFFYPDDCRLKEGPRVFCRTSQLEEQREQWEERRSELRQEYRKKHKDARKKLKTSQRTGDHGK
uniref:Nucleolar protein 8 n=1 Tax=Nothobranchius korthausae TaxID=1143690 RepID=A0A1A8ENT6_9TELE